MGPAGHGPGPFQIVEAEPGTLGEQLVVFFLDDLPHFHRFVPDVQVKIHGNSQGFLMDFSSTLIKDISFVLLPDRAPATQGSSPCATVSLVRAAPQSWAEPAEPKRKGHANQKTPIRVSGKPPIGSLWLVVCHQLYKLLYQSFLYHQFLEMSLGTILWRIGWRLAGNQCLYCWKVQLIPANFLLNQSSAIGWLEQHTLYSLKEYLVIWNTRNICETTRQIPAIRVQSIVTTMLLKWHVTYVHGKTRISIYVILHGCS